MFIILSFISYNLISQQMIDMVAMNVHNNHNTTFLKVFWGFFFWARHLHFPLLSNILNRYTHEKGKEIKMRALR